MSPKTAGQFGLIRQEKRKLILDTALELFAENGYHATSISQIAKKAGISKGLPYNYFESKKEILDEIIGVGFSSIYGNFDINHDGVLTEEEFICFIRRSFAVMRQNLRFWQLYFSLMLQPKVSETYRAGYSGIGENMSEMLYRFIVAHGSPDPEGDLVLLNVILKGAYLSAIVAPDYFPSEIVETKIIDACLELIHKNKINIQENEN